MKTKKELLNIYLGKNIEFETEYQLEEWRKIESQHFDSDNKAYTGQSMSLVTQEQMLKLINQLDYELTLRKQKNLKESDLIEWMDKICVESLSPHDFENWDKIKEFLKLVRKNLK